MRWLELSVEVDVEAVEAVSEILGRVSAGTAVHPTRLVPDPDDELAARPDPASAYVVTAHVAGDAAPGAIDGTERALWHLQAFGLGRVGRLRVREVDDVEWSDAWREHYVPQRIGRLLIVPSWVDAPEADGVPPIVLDPGMAFGTGLHPTTRGCLHMLQEVDPMPAAVLDVGSGSGILGLAALRLGAHAVDAIDTDADAVRATTENAERNGVGEQVRASRGTLPDAPRVHYGLVLANLVAAVLIDLAPRLAAHLAQEGILVASGIIKPRASEVIAAFGEAALRIHTRRDDGDWVTLRVEHAAP